MEKIIKLVRKSKNFLLRLVKRNPSLFFHSPKSALNKARRQSRTTQLIASRYSEVDKSVDNDILTYEGVISYPLKPGKEKRFSGGLINTRTNELINEGIHYNWDYCQEPPTWTPQEWSEKKHATIKSPLLFGGILFNHFGHFLSESLGRLWAYEFVRELDPYIFFYTSKGRSNYLDKKNYINQVLIGFRIPHKKILLIEQPVKVDKILIPVQKYGFGLMDNPDPVFLNFVKSFRFKNDLPKGFENADKIYVSRSKMPFITGRPIAENLFENHLRSNGFQIFYPEFYSLYQQLSVYNNAKKIIFCDGSALHACILLPNLQADIAIISRRRDPIWIWQDVTKQFQGYGKPVLWIDEIRGQYQFGLESWHALSDIDWYKVTILLKNHGFLETIFESFNQFEYSHLVKDDLRKFTQEISTKKKFIEFMMQFKEQYPA